MNEGEGTLPTCPREILRQVLQHLTDGSEDQLGIGDASGRAIHELNESGESLGNRLDCVNPSQDRSDICTRSNGGEFAQVGNDVVELLVRERSENWVGFRQGRTP